MKCMVVGAMSVERPVSGRWYSLGSAFNPTLAIAGLINAYGGGRRVNHHLQYRATGNTTARNNAGFDMGSHSFLYWLDTTKRSAESTGRLLR